MTAQRQAMVVEPIGSASRSAWWLAGILVIGAWLRFAPVGYGFPYLYHPDEVSQLQDPVRFADSVRQGNFTLPMSVPGWLFLAGIGGYWGIARLAGWTTSLAAFEQAFLMDDFHFYLVGRVVVASCSLLSVWITYRLGRAVFDRRIGLMAGALHAVSLIDISSSHWVKQDAPVTLCILVGQLALIRLAQRGRRTDWWLAGAAIGAALGARWNSAPLLAGLMAVAWGGADQVSPAPNRRQRWIGCLAALASALAVYLAVTCRPLTWIAHGLGQRPLYPTQPFEEVLMARYTAVLTGHAASPWGAVIRDNLRFYGHVLSTTMGWPFAILAFGALSVALCHRQPTLRLLGLFPAVYAIPLLIFDDNGTRYLLPMVPYACLASAWAIARGGAWLHARLRRPASLAAAVTAVVAVGLWVSVASPAWRYVEYVSRHVDSRTVAKAWIERHLPVGSVLAVEKYHEQPNMLPQLFETEAQSRLKITASRALGLGSGRAREAWFARYPSNTYTIINLSLRHPFGDVWGARVENAYDWPLLKRQGVEYVILADHVAWDHEREPAFEARLKQEGTLLARFGPTASPALQRLIFASGGYLIDSPVDIYRLPVAASTAEVDNANPS